MMDNSNSDKLIPVFRSTKFKMWQKNKKTIALLFLCHYPGITVSEELDISKDPVAIPLGGGFKFSPMLEVTESFNDNIFMRNTIKKGSFVTKTHAGGELAIEKNLNKYALTYAMQSMVYHESAPDNYVDQYVGLDSKTELTSRNRLDLGLNFLDTHYQRGQYLGRDLVDFSSLQSEPNKYYQYGVNGNYQYGNVNARGNLGVKWGVSEYKFLNDAAQTKNQNRTQYTLVPGFYNRIGTSTRLLAQIENTWVNYKDTMASNFNYDKQRYLVGANWRYSTQTNVQARIGYINQSFDNSSLNGYQDITWDLAVSWLPIENSIIDFSLSRDATPSLASESVRAYDRYKLGWQHHWSPRISSELNGSIESSSFTKNNRTNDFKSFGVDLNYSVQRWLGLGINYSYSEMASSMTAYSYDQNIIMFYVTGNPRISDEFRSPWTTWY